jgi:hypothetical protein
MGFVNSGNLESTRKILSVYLAAPRVAASNPARRPANSPSQRQAKPEALAKFAPHQLEGSKRPEQEVKAAYARRGAAGRFAVHIDVGDRTYTEEMPRR